MTKNLKFIISIFIYLIYSMNAFADDSSPSKRIVKWVDSKGVTHYGDKLPTQEAGRSNSELTKQGIVVKQNVTVDNNATPPDKDKLAQDRKDSVLLNSYTNADEIDSARDRNLQMDQATLQALTVQKENVTGRLARNTANADGYTKQKKPVPQYLLDEIKIANSEIAKLDKQIADRKQAMELIQKRFADEKTRFMALKEARQSGAEAVNKSANP